MESLDLPPLVNSIGSPVTLADLEVHKALNALQLDRQRSLDNLGHASTSRMQDLKLRRLYAWLLLLAMATQAASAHVMVYLQGFTDFDIDRWMAVTFLAGLFAEVTTLTAVVTRYLFPIATQHSQTKEGE